MSEDIMEKRKQRYEEDMDIVDQIDTLVNYQINRRSGSYELLRGALENYQRSLTDDYELFKDINGRKTLREDMRELQQALNRERKLRAELEEKVKEATESSGLFVSYVRKKLNL